MEVNDEDLYLPSISAVQNPDDLNFFVPALNNALPNNVLASNHHGDWVKSENSIAVISGSAPATAVVSGENSVVYAQGIQKQIYSTSKYLQLESESAEVTVLHSRRASPELALQAHTSNIELVDVSNATYDINLFRFDGQKLLYLDDDYQMSIELTGDSTISIYSVAETNELSIESTAGKYTLSDGQTTVTLGTSDNSNVNTSQLNGENFAYEPNAHIQPSDDQQTDLNSGANETENIADYYDGNNILFQDEELAYEAPNLSPALTSYETPNIEALKLEASLAQNISQLLSSDEDNFIFEDPSDAHRTTITGIKQLAEVNSKYLDQAIDTMSIFEFITEDALNFYDTI